MSLESKKKVLGPLELKLPGGCELLSVGAEH